MKKFAVAVLIIGAFILYSLLYGHANVVAVLPNNSTNSSSSGRGSSTSVVPATPGTTNTPGTPGSLYKDGSYTGSVADAQWGYIQVKAIISNGKITDVQFLQYPNERNRSIMINNYADPQLTSEAIAAQSANVDIVTGATDTSQAFIQSLSDALSQAKA
ncbi:MAG TPA: FMN-binding protein [Ktedonobacteraceae bacterium]|nr:FMN-binding protein [Ktedonobacteraceae bacterium]